MIRVAAIGDVHVGLDDGGLVAPGYADLHEHADLLLIAGDLTRHGDPAEAKVLAQELESVQVPVYMVLGNHDHHLDAGDEIRAILEDAGLHVLEQETAIVEVGGGRLAIVGAKGFGGGFEGACGSEFGEPEMKAFVRHTRQISEQLGRQVVEAAGADRTIVLLHYAPCADTCQGERREIFPFLGSYLLGEATDAATVDLVLHGHAHHGSERGCTTGGTPVRNVARPLVGSAYRRFELAVERAGERAGRMQAVAG